MDKIKKALARLTAQERAAVRFVLLRIERGELHSLDVKKLRERDDIFRVRKGAMRIIFRISKTREVFILSLERRSEKTYKKN